MMEKLFCEKCGSEDVSQTIRMPEEKERENRTSIADFKGPSMITNAVYKTTTLDILCKKCGNSKTITY